MNPEPGSKTMGGSTSESIQPLQRLESLRSDHLSPLRQFTSQQVVLTSLLAVSQCQVWKGCWMGKFVAVKIFNDKQKLVLEVMALEKLGAADCVVRALGWCEEKLWIVFPFKEGGSLSHWLASRESAISLIQALRVAHDVAWGMMKSEEAGLRHRDLKAANILLEGPAPVAAVGDFGEAEKGGQCTLAYASQRVLGGSVGEMGDDAWAFGVVLWELLTATLEDWRDRERRPVRVFALVGVENDRLQHLLYLREFGPPFLLEDGPKDRLQGFQDVLAKCFSGRYSSWKEVVSDLDALFSRVDGRASVFDWRSCRSILSEYYRQEAQKDPFEKRYFLDPWVVKWDMEGQSLSCIKKLARQRLDGRKLLDSGGKVALLGVAGSGKSTLLRQMGREWAAGKFWTEKTVLCIHLWEELKAMKERIQVSMEAILRQHWGRMASIVGQIHFRDCLKAMGEYFLLVDGLDEARRDFGEEQGVKAFLDIGLLKEGDWVVKGACGLMIASRIPLPVQRESGGWQLLEVAGFTEDMQTDYINAYFEVVHTEEAVEGKTILNGLLTNEPHLRDLGCVPLQLFFLCRLAERREGAKSIHDIRCVPALYEAAIALFVRYGVRSGLSEEVSINERSILAKTLKEIAGQRSLHGLTMKHLELAHRSCLIVCENIDQLRPTVEPPDKEYDSDDEVPEEPVINADRAQWRWYHPSINDYYLARYGVGKLLREGSGDATPQAVWNSAMIFYKAIHPAKVVEMAEEGLYAHNQEFVFDQILKDGIIKLKLEKMVHASTLCHRFAVWLAQSRAQECFLGWGISMQEAELVAEGFLVWPEVHGWKEVINLDLSQVKDESGWFLRSLVRIGLLFAKGSMFLRATEVLSCAVNVSLKRGRKKEIASCLSNFALVLKQGGNPEDATLRAKESIARWEELGEPSPSIYPRSILAGIAKDSGDYAGAVTVYQELDKLLPADNLAEKAVNLHNLAYSLHRLGKSDEALSICAEAQNLLGDDPEDLLSLRRLVSLIRTELGDHQAGLEESAAILRQTEKIHGVDNLKSITASATYAISLMQSGNSEEALRIFLDCEKRLEKIEAGSQEKAHLFNEIAKISLLMKQLEQSRTYAQRCLALDPEEPASKGIILFMEGKMEELETLFLGLRRIDDGVFICVELLGRGFEQRDQKGKAVMYYVKACRLFEPNSTALPEYADCLQNVGVTILEMGQSREAYPLFMRALELRKIGKSANLALVRNSELAVAGESNKDWKHCVVCWRQREWRQGTIVCADCQAARFCEQHLNGDDVHRSVCSLVHECQQRIK